MTTSTNESATVHADLYREVHKGIRHALFHTTIAAGSVDPHDGADVDRLLAEYRTLVELLTTHHDHEDARIQPLVVTQGGDLAATVAADHERIEREMAELDLAADRYAAAPGARRGELGQRFYLDLASFTSGYLVHQRLEEDRVMPMLTANVPSEELLDVLQAIRRSVPPELMCRFLRHMLPAMNVDERTGMLGGMRAMVPAPVFAMFRGTAETVLSAADWTTVAGRIGIA